MTIVPPSGLRIEGRDDRRRDRDSARPGVILGTSRPVRVLVYPAPCDLRKGYDDLYGLVQTGLGRDPLSGELSLFVNQSRKLYKVLCGTAPGCASRPPATEVRSANDPLSP
jgi:hypothetical protein